VASNVNINNTNHLRRQNSQPHLYGSHFSLNSNYADPYGAAQPPPTLPPQPVHYHQHSLTSTSSTGAGGTANFYPASHYSQSNPSLYSPPNSNSNANTHPNSYNSQQQNQTMSQTAQQYQQAQNNANNNSFGNSPDYPPEFGLPTVPLSVGGGGVSSPPRRFTSPPNPYGNNSGSPSSRAPPPYRPPPPAGRFATSPTGPPPPPVSSNPHAILRRSSMSSSSIGVPYHRTNSVPGSAGPGPGSYYSTSSSQNINIPKQDVSPQGMFQYQRSLSGFCTYFLAFCYVLASVC
jgi:hypothetical protein